MAIEIKLPRLGQGMEAGTIVRWLKSEGDEVAKGEPLFELDTDKVTQEVEADAAGVLLKIVVAGGRGERRHDGRGARCGRRGRVRDPRRRPGRERGRTGRRGSGGGTRRGGRGARRRPSRRRRRRQEREDAAAASRIRRSTPAPPSARRGRAGQGQPAGPTDRAGARARHRRARPAPGPRAGSSPRTWSTRATAPLRAPRRPPLPTRGRSRSSSSRRFDGRSLAV